MTGSGSGAPGRDGTWAAASVWGTGLAMAIVMAIGLIVRLIMAYGIDGLRGSGFETDLGLFRYWAAELAANGPLGFYDRGFYADYTPRVDQLFVIKPWVYAYRAGMPTGQIRIPIAKDAIPEPIRV